MIFCAAIIALQRYLVSLLVTLWQTMCPTSYLSQLYLDSNGTSSDVLLLWLVWPMVCFGRLGMVGEYNFVRSRDMNCNCIIFQTECLGEYVLSGRLFRWRIMSSRYDTIIYMIEKFALINPLFCFYLWLMSHALIDVIFIRFLLFPARRFLLIVLLTQDFLVTSDLTGSTSLSCAPQWCCHLTP